jgi:hypothetical protein
LSRRGMSNEPNPQVQINKLKKKKKKTMLEHDNGYSSLRTIDINFI